MAVFADISVDKELLSLCESNAKCLIEHCSISADGSAPLKNAHGEPWVATPGNDRSDLHLKVYCSKEPDSKLLRWVGVCKFPKTKCYELMTFLQNFEKRGQWDPNCTVVETHVLYEWAAANSNGTSSSNNPKNAMKLLRCETPAMGPISARDFVDINYIRHDLDEQGNITAVLSCGGVTPALDAYQKKHCPTLFPELSGIVRGLTSGGSGWYMPQDRDPVSKELLDSCTLYYVIHSDIKGWLPTVLINNTVGGTFAQFFEKLKEVLAK